MYKIILLLLSSVILLKSNAIEEAYKNGDINSLKSEFLKKSGIDNPEASAMLINLSSKYAFKVDTKQHLQNIFNSEDASHYFFSVHDKLYSSIYGGDTDEELVKILLEALSDPKINAISKGIITDLLSRYYNSIYQYEKERELVKNLGVIDNWAATGEFENISGSGFDNDFGPLENPQSGSKFQNKTNFDVTWFDLPNKHHKLWTFMNYYLSYENSILFAQSFVKSDRDQEAIFRVGTSGSLKAYLNDNLIISESEERNNNVDTYLAKVKLNKGWNRILLQLGSSEIENNNFTVRFTDKNGNPLLLTSKAEYKEYSKSESKPDLIDNPAENFFKNKIEKNDNNFADHYLLNQILLSNEKFKIARKYLNNLRKTYPESPIVTREFVELYSRSGNRTLHSIELEKLKNQAPENPLSLEIEYSEYLKADDYNKCEEMIQKFDELFGKAYEQVILIKKITLAYKKEEYDKRRDLIEEAFEKYPNNTYFLNYQYRYYKNQLNDLSEAEDILTDYLEDTYSQSLMSNLADFYADQGDLDDALEIYEKILENDENYPGNYQKIAKFHQNQDNSQEAKKYYEISYKMTPYDTYVIDKIANIDKELGNKDEAIKKYKLITEIYPYDYSALEQLRILQDKKPIWELFDEPDLDAIYEDKELHIAKEDENVEILHNEVQTVKYENGAFTQKYFFLAKANNKSGTDILQTYYIPYYGNQRYNIEKAEVLKIDGTSLKAERSGAQLVFTNLEEGDAIKVIYTLNTRQLSTLIGQYWDKMYFNTFFPVRKAKYSLAIEGEDKFNYILNNSEKEPIINRKNNFKIYTWKFENLEAIKYENFMPSLDDIGIVLHYSSIPDWNFINEWYQKLAKNKAESDLEVKETISNIFEGKEIELSDLEKAEKIYNYVVNNIRYSSISFRQSGLIPQKASDVINTKIGDCKDVSTLFVALCEEVGIDANLVLVNTREFGEKAMPLPSIDFNHCIANLNINNDNYYVELTSDKLPFAAYDFSLKNSFTLDIETKEKEPKLLDPVTRKANMIIRNTTVNLNENKAVVKTNTIKTGGEAARMRYSYADLTEEDRFKAMQEALSGTLPALQLQDLSLEDIRTNKDTLNYSYEYTSEDPYTNIASMQIVKIPWTDANDYSELVSQNKRKYPLSLWMVFNSDKQYEEIEIKLPENKKLQELPKDVNISNDIFEYNVKYEQKDNKLFCTRTAKLKQDVVIPDLYPKFKSDLEKMMKADKTQIAITNIK